jgi:hypothetical protein
VAGRLRDFHGVGAGSARIWAGVCSLVAWSRSLLARSPPVARHVGALQRIAGAPLRFTVADRHRREHLVAQLGAGTTGIADLMPGSCAA